MDVELIGRYSADRKYQLVTVAKHNTDWIPLIELAALIFTGEEEVYEILFATGLGKMPEKP